MGRPVQYAQYASARAWNPAKIIGENKPDVTGEEGHERSG